MHIPVEGTDMNITIRVERAFQPSYSDPIKHEFMFAYRIVIKNNNPFAVMVRSRQWNVFDSNWEERIIEGDGVLGMQPVIAAAGGEFDYVSGCNLHSEIGQMQGQYTMENLETRELFKVHIPRFEFYAPFKLN